MLNHEPQIGTPVETSEMCSFQFFCRSLITFRKCSSRIRLNRSIIPSVLVHHNKNISVYVITNRKRARYVHSYPLERCALVILLQLTAISSYGTLISNTLDSVCYPIRHCLLTSNPIKTLF